jgi:CRP/FNR family cyclic AMP-dependent transcriptional regulator
MSSTAGMVRLLALDPDLGILLGNARRREQAERELLVAIRRLPVGAWDVSDLDGTTADHLGLLLVQGVLLRQLAVAGQVSVELLEPGDLVRPWQPAGGVRLLPVDVGWWVLSPLTLAVLDRRFAAEAARYPEVIATLFERLSQRSLRLATSQAISQLTRVDRRIMALFWHLAERWGRVSGDGMIVPLGLTHRTLGQLVGARRPTVSSALSDLIERGQLSRRPDGSWLLRDQPPNGPGLSQQRRARDLLRPSRFAREPARVDPIG